jgi:hypothetical protein
VSYAPVSIKNLRSYLAAVTGLSATSLGIVGNTAHKRGYHLGRDRIYDGSGPGVGNLDYSVQLTRDKAGLTDAASAIDIGNFTDLRKLSTWLVLQCQAGECPDIREVIYSPDGKVVKRWDNSVKKLYTGGDGTGHGDDSHLTHTHVSFYRDSESRDKVETFRPFFEPSTGDEMPAFKVVDLPTGVLTLQDEDGIHYLRLRDNKLIEVTDRAAFGSKEPILPVRMDEPIVPGKPDTDDWTLGYIVGEDAAFVLQRNAVVKSPTYSVSVGGKPAGSVSLP